jgi:hypothetical protein
MLTIARTAILLTGLLAAGGAMAQGVEPKVKPLSSMCGSSGLHYSENSALLGDGTYSATVTVMSRHSNANWRTSICDPRPSAQNSISS